MELFRTLPNSFACPLMLAFSLDFDSSLILVSALNEAHRENVPI